ncbi:MAG: hypothetical protein LH647_21620 [Leptolyngbyaceae cyanobacterium CAN_BIN12]|nr:hypothetical protein [Leptolyngbyaceae cyanobacterium CAN_BIN12]
MNSQPRSHPTKVVTVSATWVSPRTGGMDFVKKGERVANADENGYEADFEPILNGWFSKSKQAHGVHVA